ncbi:MAG: hypothetical protein HQK86_02410 [Nitrospinae bacterium]|nr:hypothetical protein [Nitrospinota bacterium]
MSRSFAHGLVSAAISPIVYPPVFIVAFLGKLFGGDDAAEQPPEQAGGSVKKDLSNQIESLQSQKAMAEHAIAGLAERERSLRSAIAGYEMELREKETASRTRDEQELLDAQNKKEALSQIESLQSQKAMAEHAIAGLAEKERSLRSSIAGYEMELREKETASRTRDEQELLEGRSRETKLNLELETKKRELERQLALVSDEMAQKRLASEERLQQEIAGLRKRAEIELAAERDRGLANILREVEARRSEQFSRLEEELRQSRDKTLMEQGYLNDRMSEINHALAETREKGLAAIEEEFGIRKTEIGREAANLRESRLSELETELAERKKGVEKEIERLRAESELTIKTQRERDRSELNRERGALEADIAKEIEAARQNAFAELERAIAERRAKSEEEIRTKQKGALAYIESWTERETARLRDRLKEEFDIQLEEMRKQLQAQSGKTK